MQLLVQAPSSLSPLGALTRDGAAPHVTAA
jgi:hypothetical protein